MVRLAISMARAVGRGKLRQDSPPITQAGLITPVRASEQSCQPLDHQLQFICAYIYLCLSCVWYPCHLFVRSPTTPDMRGRPCGAGLVVGHGDGSANNYKYKTAKVRDHGPLAGAVHIRSYLALRAKTAKAVAGSSAESKHAPPTGDMEVWWGDGIGEEEEGHGEGGAGCARVGSRCTVILSDGVDVVDDAATGRPVTTRATVLALFVDGEAGPARGFWSSWWPLIISIIVGSLFVLALGAFIRDRYKYSRRCKPIRRCLGGAASALDSVPQRLSRITNGGTGGQRLSNGGQAGSTLASLLDAHEAGGGDGNNGPRRRDSAALHPKPAPKARVEW